MKLSSAACIRRYPGNPVLSAKDVPYEALLIFNDGVTPELKAHLRGGAE